MVPNGGQPGDIWREVVTNRVPFGSRHCTFGALWRAIRLCWNYLVRSGANKVPLGAKLREISLARAITFQWILIGGFFAPKGDMFAPFGATWRTLVADCLM